MKKPLIISILIISFQTVLLSQENQPIWGIGTKWTHEFNWMWSNNNIHDYAITEIVDTVTIDGLKLYKAERIHSTCNSNTYLHYQDQKVYSYDINRKLLQLLYDFGEPEDYTTKYEIQCDFNANLDDPVVDLPIKIDSISDYEMPDGTIRKIQYLSAIDTFRSNNSLFMNHNRTVLEGIGFLDKYSFDIHEWSINEYFCDHVSCFPKYLRCFENDSMIYNFTGFPCDSVFTSNVEELNIETLNIYPNPTNNSITILSNANISEIKIYTLEGKTIIDRNFRKGESINLPKPAVYILKARVNKAWITRKIIRIE